MASRAWCRSPEASPGCPRDRCSRPSPRPSADVSEHGRRVEMRNMANPVLEIAEPPSPVEPSPLSPVRPDIPEAPPEPDPERPQVEPEPATDPDGPGIPDAA